MDRPDARCSRWGIATEAFVFAGAYVGLAWLGSLLSFPAARFGAIWGPSGLFLAALLSRPGRWKWFVMAAFGANLANSLLHGRPVLPSAAFGISNCLQGVAAAVIIRRVAGRSPQNGFRWTASLLGFGAVLAPALGALMATGVAAAMDAATPVFETWVGWWTAAAIGVALVTPLMVHARSTRSIRDQWASTRAMVLSLALGVGMAAVSWFLFRGPAGVGQPYKYVLFFLAVGISQVGGPLAVGIGNVLLAVVVMGLSAGGHGEFGGLDGNVVLSVLSAQGFLFALCSLGLILNASVQDNRRITAAAAKEEATYHALFSELGLGFSLQRIVRDAGGNPVDYFTVEVNRAYESMLGVPSVEVVGRRAADLLPAAELERWISVFGPVASGAPPRHYELYSPSNKRHFRGYVFSPERDRFAVIFEDVTEERLADAQLKESEERYRSLVENAEVGILLTNPANGAIEEANPAACAMLGMTLDELKAGGRNALVVEDDPRLAAAYDERERSGRFRGELSFRRKDGSLLPVEVTSSVFRSATGELRSSMIVRDLSPWKKAEDAIRAGEERYRSLVQSAMDAILLTTRDGEILDANPAALGLFGYDRHAFIGMNEDQIAVATDPRLAPMREERERAGKARGTIRHVRRDGTTFEAGVTSAAFAAAGGDVQYSTIIRDISERRRLEEDLRESEARFRAIFEQAPVGIAVRNESTGGVIRANRELCAILGMTEEQLLAPDFELPAALSGVRIAGNRDGWSEERLTRPDGMEAWVRVLDIAIRPETPPGFRMTLVEDLTRRRELERGRELQEQKLIEAQRLASLGTLAATLAHELHNPTHSIRISAGVVSRAWKSAEPILEEYRGANGDFALGGIWYADARVEVPSCIDRIGAAAAHIDEVVSSLRHSFRTEETADLVSLDDVVSAAVALMGPAISEHAHNFSLELSAGRTTVRGNFARLEQVVINLLQNACDAVRPPGSSVRVVTRAEEEWVCLVVEDNGIGMDDATRARVLEPFFTTRGTTGGLGLGLPISHSIVRSHAGAISFESEPGRGTRVTVRLPRGEHGGKKRPA